jgi:ribose transport system substrate-binding protein
MKYTSFIIIISILYACEAPPRFEDVKNIKNTEGFITADKVTADEEYVMITTAINMPMYVNHDQRAFKQWGEKMGVKVSILGPAEWDVSAQIATIEQVIPQKPAGMLINGTDPGIAQAINKAVAAGIPTVVYDSEITGSKRHSFIGSDWYEMGRLQGERMVKITSGKGKVAVMGILGLENMEDGFRGFQDVLKGYPNMVFLGKYDDKANVETAAKLAADLIAANPDLVGISGFDSNSGPGIALSVKEANKVGKVKITTVDAEPEHLKLVKEGVIDYLVGQKRELFTQMGAQMLFDMRHKSVALSRNDAKAGVIPIPRNITTGSIEIDINNVDLFMK